jgi:hypothetical protein
MKPRRTPRSNQGGTSFEVGTDRYASGGPGCDTTGAAFLRESTLQPQRRSINSATSHSRSAQPYPKTVFLRIGSPRSRPRRIHRRHLRKSSVKSPLFRTASDRDGNRMVRGGRPRLHQVTLIRVHLCPSVVAPSRSGSETLRDAKASPAERRFDCDGAAPEDRSELISVSSVTSCFKPADGRKQREPGMAFEPHPLRLLSFFAANPDGRQKTQEARTQLGRPIRMNPRRRAVRHSPLFNHRHNCHGPDPCACS